MVSFLRVRILPGRDFFLFSRRSANNPPTQQARDGRAAGAPEVFPSPFSYSSLSGPFPFSRVPTCRFFFFHFLYWRCSIKAVAFLVASASCGRRPLFRTFSPRYFPYRHVAWVVIGISGSRLPVSCGGRRFLGCSRDTPFSFCSFLEVSRSLSSEKHVCF